MLHFRPRHCRGLCVIVPIIASNGFAKKGNLLYKGRT